MDPLALAAIAVWSFVVAVAGGAAGLVLGNLRLPLVVLLASSPSAAAAANVAISGASAAAAAAAHIRAGRVNWRLLAFMVPPTILGGFLGGLAAGRLPDRVLLFAIASVVFYSAFAISRPSSRGSAPPTATGIRAVPTVLIGLIVGVLGGLVGLILGTLRLPAMLRWAGAATREAVGSNSAVGFTLAIGAVLGHLGSGIDWDIVAVGGAAGIPGALIGARFVGRLPEGTLIPVIAVILAVSGAAMVAAALLR